MNEQSVINNKEFLINKNLEEPKINNNILNEESTMINNNNLEEPKINYNKANNEKPKRNKKSTSNKKKSTFVKTPQFLKPRKALLNPQSIDNKSFQHSIKLSLYYK